MILINSKKIFLALILLLIVTNLFAIQDTRYNAGESAAMANTSVTNSGLWSIYTNQAGLGYLETMKIGAYHQAGYVTEQNLQGVAFALPTKTGTIGTSYSYYGFSQYNESQFGLAFGRNFSKYFSVGLQLNYLHTHIAGDYGNASSINFEIGILSEPIENLLIAAHVYNPSHNKMKDENIPTILKLGTSYLFSEKLLLAIETESDLVNKTIFKTGINYQLINAVSIQAGVSTNPGIYSFGVGFHLKKTITHVGFQKHQILGFTPSFTLSYDF